MLDFCRDVPADGLWGPHTKATWGRLANTGFVAMIRAAGYGWSCADLCLPEGVRYLWLSVHHLISAPLAKADCGMDVPDTPERACCVCYGMDEIQGVLDPFEDQFEGAVHADWIAAIAAMRVALIDVANAVKVP